MSMINSPAVGANTTVANANSSSNSSQISTDNRHNSIPDLNSTNRSTDLSSVNSDSYSPAKSENSEELNMSLLFKHNIEKVDLSDPPTQEDALRYLLEKVRDMETLLINTVTDNMALKKDLNTLFTKNALLVSENVKLQEIIMFSANEIAKGEGYRLTACGFRPFLNAVCGFGPRFSVFPKI